MMRIAVQGVPGCFSEQAALALRPGAAIIHCPNFAGIFAALDEGRADRGLVPVENTLAGAVVEARAELDRHPVEVEAEHRLQIEMCLLLHPAAQLDQIVRVLSHPVALRQCGRFLAAHPDWQVVSFFDTAGSVEEIMRLGGVGRLDSAAIASAHAGAVYGARIAIRGIGDLKENFTRFFLVAKAGGRVTG